MKGRRFSKRGTLYRKPLSREERIQRAAMNLAISEFAGIDGSPADHFAFWGLKNDPEAQAQVRALATIMVKGD